MTTNLSKGSLDSSTSSCSREELSIGYRRSFDAAVPKAKAQGSVVNRHDATYPPSGIADSGLHHPLLHHPKLHQPVIHHPEPLCVAMQAALMHYVAKIGIEDMLSPTTGAFGTAFD